MLLAMKVIKQSEERRGHEEVGEEQGEKAECEVPVGSANCWT